MDRQKLKKWIIRGVWIAIGVFVLIAASITIYNWPVYPLLQKPAVSVTAAQNEISEFQDTEGMIVINPSDLGLDAKEIVLVLHGRMRYSKPIGYWIVCQDFRLSDTDVSLKISGYDWDVLSHDDETYRGMPTSVTVKSAAKRELEINMICRGFFYMIEASYQSGNKTQTEIDALDNQITALLYHAMDLVIDADPEALTSYQFSPLTAVGCSAGKLPAVSMRCAVSCGQLARAAQGLNCTLASSR